MISTSFPGGESAGTVTKPSGVESVTIVGIRFVVLAAASHAEPSKPLLQRQRAPRISSSSLPAPCGASVEAACLFTM